MILVQGLGSLVSLTCGWHTHGNGKRSHHTIDYLGKTNPKSWTKWSGSLWWVFGQTYMVMDQRCLKGLGIDVSDPRLPNGAILLKDPFLK